MHFLPIRGFNLLEQWHIPSYTVYISRLPSGWAWLFPGGKSPRSLSFPVMNPNANYPIRGCLMMTNSWKAELSLEGFIAFPICFVAE